MYTEQDLELILEDHLTRCSEYANVCRLNETHEGHNRIVKRIKELIFNDGIMDADTAIAMVDSEISWTETSD